MSKSFADKAVDIDHWNQEKFRDLIKVLEYTNSLSVNIISIWVLSSEFWDPFALIQIDKKEGDCLGHYIDEIGFHKLIGSFKLCLLWFFINSVNTYL